MSMEEDIDIVVEKALPFMVAEVYVDESYQDVQRLSSTTLKPPETLL